MANAEPHTHEPKIRREYGELGGYWELTYGDTTVKVCSGYRFGYPFVERLKDPTEKQIDRALRKAAKKHDQGSKALATRIDPVVALRGLIADKDGQSWLSDQLERKA